MGKDKYQQIKSLDYLKTISIFMVIVTHLSFTAISRKTLLFPYWIDMAVPFFFIISGYMYSLSWEKRELRNLKDWFGCKNFLDKFLRIFLPYIIIFGIEILLFRILHRNVTVREIIYGFFTGGWGPGSYYFPVLVQLLLLFPFVFSLSKKKYGWFILIYIEILLEILIQKLGVSDTTYRLLFFRYLGFVTFGILLYLHSTKRYVWVVSKILNKKCLLFLAFLSGIAIIFLLNYSFYQPLLFKRWTTTSLPTLLYSFPLVFSFTKAESLIRRVPKALDDIVRIIAKSTFHIFLTQMAYYWFYKQDAIRLRYSVVQSFLICISAGILFYYIENYLTTRLFKRRNS